ncbi:MAG: DnaJ domain-containing protein [Spirochaetaceae bacterium]|jgi:tetratricopeptide (TPR) repeat protein|nr:DnaJ domain-containing protein [Spirochaetaceae bacterium]
MMDNYYSLLGITQNASPQDIKKAFREQAKRLHPDIAGAPTAEKMRKLLTAYEVLSDRERRYEYDRAYGRFIDTYHFDYRTFLRERPDDPGNQAKLVFFSLLHLEEEEALAIWRSQGGLDFPMERYLDREDWMDCTFILAEELEKRQCYYEAFMLLIALIREERRLPYFRHFMGEVEIFLKEIVRLKLKPSVDPEIYVQCIETLLEMGFSPKDEARWMRSMAEVLIHLGELRGAETVFREALKRDPGLPNTMRLRRKLQV